MARNLTSEGRNQAPDDRVKPALPMDNVQNSLGQVLAFHWKEQSDGPLFPRAPLKISDLVLLAGKDLFYSLCITSYL